MGWLPFSSSSKTSSKDSNGFSASPQVEQKSHQSIGLSSNAGTMENGSDISHTLGQITNDQDLSMTEHGTQSVEESNKAVTEFVDQRPNNMFIIDGEKDIKQSIICTSNGTGGKTCLKLQYNSIQLFKQMQKLEYFCSLPEDIDATYFECRKIK